MTKFSSVKIGPYAYTINIMKIYTENILGFKNSASEKVAPQNFIA